SGAPAQRVGDGGERARGALPGGRRRGDGLRALGRDRARGPGGQPAGAGGGRPQAGGAAAGARGAGGVRARARPAEGAPVAVTVSAVRPLSVQSIGELIGGTPLIRLKRLEPREGVEIWAKAEFMNPGGSVKDRAAYQMVMDGIASGAFTQD